MQRRVVIILIVVTLLGNAFASPVGEVEGDRLVRAYFRAQKSGICNVHHIRMQKKYVPIAWGYIEYDPLYDSAEIREFPNAREYVNGGCQIEQKKIGHLVPIYVCPQCKIAEKQWALRHPKNSNAQWILSHPNA